MKFSYGPPSFPTFEDLIRGYPDAEFAKVTRSTVPLLGYWGSSEQRRRFGKEIGVEGLDAADAHFEFSVPASCADCKLEGQGKGRGKSSFTDLLLRHESTAVVIEAKFTEPRYQTVGKWLSDGSDRPNRARVLAHWLHLVRSRTEHRVENDQVEDVIYQLVHRTASACSLARAVKHLHIVYLIFEKSRRAKAGYEDDMKKIANRLDPGGALFFSVVRVGVRETEALEQAKGAIRSEGPDAIRDALLGTTTPLYEYELPNRTFAAP